MRCWILEQIVCWLDRNERHASDGCILIDGSQRLSEFLYEEIDLLAKFVNIVGYSEGLSISVLKRSDGMFGYPYLRNFGFPLSDYERAEKRSKSYLFVDEDSLSSPDLFMRFGIKALVTDRGMLVYLDPLKNDKLHIGDFCNYMRSHSIVSAKMCMYYLDNRVKGIGSPPCALVGFKPLFNVTSVTDKVLLDRVTKLCNCNDIILDET